MLATMNFNDVMMMRFVIDVFVEAEQKEMHAALGSVCLFGDEQGVTGVLIFHSFRGFHSYPARHSCRRSEQWTQEPS